jgi:hypothetical protein
MHKNEVNWTRFVKGGDEDGDEGDDEGDDEGGDDDEGEVGGG